MPLLRTAIILALAASAAPAFAEQISCESRQSGPEPCGTIVAGSSVRLVRQLSDAACIEGRTWGTGAAHDSLWVSGGCRAVFDVQPGADASDSALADSGDDAAADSGDNEPDYRDDRGYAGNEREDDGDDNDAGDDNDDAQHDRSNGYTRGDDDRYAASRDSRLDARSPGGADADAQDNTGDQGEADESARGDSDRQIASAAGGYARARQACIDEALAGSSFAADDVDAGGVRTLDDDLLSIDIRTPDGALTCTVDRDGNVRSLR